MGKRHESIGIKQVVRLEWYDLALDMQLEGRPTREIRRELTGLLRDRLQSGGFGERGEATYTKAVAQLMKCWVAPDKDLVALRDRALLAARAAPRSAPSAARLALHWAMTMAAYPFWHAVAAQAGRLLNLQPLVTQAQIRKRVQELFGERSTVERSTRRVIRSFVDWGVLKDSQPSGCYGKNAPHAILEPSVAVALVEATLHTSPTGSIALRAVKDNPALFPFVLPTLNETVMSAPGIVYIRHGLDDELLRIRP